MKILYISSDPTDAELAASALHTAAAGVVVSTAASLQDAALWILNNLDVAALILDARFGPAASAAFLKHLRTRCLKAPVIIVAARESVGAIDAFGLGQGDCVVLKEMLTRDLGSAVQQAIGADCTESLKVVLLQWQLDDIRTYTERLFDASPLPLFRSSHNGMITRANGAFAALFGCPSATDTRTLELASDLFNSSQELAWLTERSVSTGTASSIECVRRKVDGSRLVLRLLAFATLDAIHVVVEDITAHWVLQERLGRAQRMEAVGRLAAEVALTCGNLLQSVNAEGLKWVTTLQDPVSRQTGERMLSEVVRATGLLKELSDYGDEHASAAEPVDLHQVLHDLEPILQELVGDHVQVVIPETPPREVPRFNVDLEAERVERLLVNLAGFSRARMPSGGKLIFDVSPIFVDRDYVEAHPNVRQGSHVLLTVTEGKDSDAPAGLLRILDRFRQKTDTATTTGRPVIDFGTLRDLVQECGGHLWMEADSPRDITIKLHLPLRAA